MKEETAFQADPGRTEAEKKASVDRVTVATKSRAEIDEAAVQAERLSKQSDQAIDAAAKDLETALVGLRAKVAERKKATPHS